MNVPTHKIPNTTIHECIVILGSSMRWSPFYHPHPYEVDNFDGSSTFNANFSASCQRNASREVGRQEFDHSR